jgi:hypothetical protein
MASPHLHRLNRSLRSVTAVMGVATLAVVAVALHSAGSSTQALVVRRDSEEGKWQIFEEADVQSGVTIPANTNVTFHLPFTFTRISQEVLFGKKGQDVRYWGYCFPQNYDPAAVAKRRGLRGLLFLSAKEAQVQEKIIADEKVRFSLARLPKDKQELENATANVHGAIRPQISVFEAGMLCYVMTESPLAMGLDPDGDRLNDVLERTNQTDPQNPDTDGDGVLDGTEVFTHTDPLRRDTDGDGVIDGIEDENWNGRVELGETNPRVKDSDGDGLCDGLCRIRVRRGLEIFAGEDKNLNGLVDEGETDPGKKDTDGDKINDYQEFLNCLSSNAPSC